MACIHVQITIKCALSVYMPSIMQTCAIYTQCKGCMIIYISKQRAGKVVPCYQSSSAMLYIYLRVKLRSLKSVAKSICVYIYIYNIYIYILPMKSSEVISFLFQSSKCTTSVCVGCRGASVKYEQSQVKFTRISNDSNNSNSKRSRVACVRVRM